jgi:hypothetical protein
MERSFEERIPVTIVNSLIILKLLLKDTKSHWKSMMINFTKDVKLENKYIRDLSVNQ